MTRIVLIHAVEVAMRPVEAAMREFWPAAQCGNLLDDALPRDLEAAGTLTPAITGRIGALADYAANSGAQGVLFTCSAFGPAIDEAAKRLPIPVLKPNEAMFEASLDAGGVVGMLATFEPSIPSMTREFDDEARRREVSAQLDTVYVPGALDALKSGDAATHDRLLAEAAPRLAHCSTILLAHFSTARAAAAIAARSTQPVLTSPGSAVMKLRRLTA
ncbi:aspartate/glutamate racemase family protein [Paraburkholderia fungorum]|uniref:aspartate/glutamate racemase family protein n=1 Tax=Paraburkholderia fungorum TaxID=134537 RepID=UPI0038BC0031